MRILTLLSFTLLAPSASFGSLFTSAEVDGCIPAIQTGTSSASVDLLCRIPPVGGMLFDRGGAAASAAFGDVSAEAIFFVGNGPFPNGTATARFGDLLELSSAEIAPLFLDLRVHYTGQIQNHAESNGFGSITWLVNGTGAGTYVHTPLDPATFDFFITYSGVISLNPGETFTLSAEAAVSASDYFGHSKIRGELVGIDARNSSGELVSASTVVVPEPGTFAVVLFAVAEIVVGRRKSLIPTRARMRSKPGFGAHEK